MSNLHNFLVEHAMFPFPQPTEGGPSTGTTDISLFEVPKLDREWKAKYAVRDNMLVQKLCNTLQNILGDTILSADAENQLLSRFSPRIDRILLSTGVLKALGDCLWECDMKLVVKTEQVADRGSSRIDYNLKVDDEDGGLVELPWNGIKLTWTCGQSLVPRMLTKAALYLGLRQMEWLFITCHNYWIVCHLVKNDHHPFLAYSPMISINGSSAPFRALLGAILSVTKKVPVEPTKFDPNMDLDTIDEGEDQGPCSHHHTGQRKAESGLMVTSSSQNSPESSQVWIHLYPFLNNMLALPQCAKSGNRRLWLTHFVGSGSTGNVWQCHFDGSIDFFIAKVVDVLCLADTDKQQRLHDEFNIYLTLESRQPHDCIAPHCYGAFEGNGVAILILDLCDGILNGWGELNDSERLQLYKMVWDLHRIGISHGDLEPRNIARTREHRLCLIDFSESKGSKICSELQTFQKFLWKQQPL
ncbi:hypothetical protein K443DRAFT_127259 [Laccaria amethystina LaAM-08-1]|uniref:Unplaced genomic scaffold K443scaffold_2, whole genome shotgun sequence n=1 Tax=Laccaria amethystina LaAM-08-1 TaxID=1095629 RepID=A0A0C9XC83_9AGAR|nr:hypothetical protein K443DRAFT_127259 [Laccaria amethystina LaAM-08-1]